MATKYFSERKRSFAEYGTIAFFASMGIFGLVITTPKLLTGDYNFSNIFLEIGGGGILKSSIDMI